MTSANGTVPSFEYLDPFSRTRLTVTTLDEEGTAQLTLSFEEEPTRVALSVDIGDDGMVALRDYLGKRARDYETAQEQEDVGYRRDRAVSEAELAQRAFVTHTKRSSRQHSIKQEHVVHLRTCPAVVRADGTVTALNEVLSLVAFVHQSGWHTLRFCQRCNPLGTETASVNDHHELRPPVVTVEESLKEANRAHQTALLSAGMGDGE